MHNSIPSHDFPLDILRSLSSSSDTFSPRFLPPSESYPGSILVVLLGTDVNFRCSRGQWGVCIHCSISSFFDQLCIEHILWARHWNLVESQGTQSLPHGAYSVSKEIGTSTEPGAALISQDHNSFLSYLYSLNCITLLGFCNNSFSHELGQCQAPVVLCLCKCIYFVLQYSSSVHLILLVTAQHADLLKSFKSWSRHLFGLPLSQVRVIC